MLKKTGVESFDSGSGVHGKDIKTGTNATHLIEYDGEGNKEVNEFFLTAIERLTLS